MSISAAKQQASLRVFTWAEWQYDLGANSVDPGAKWTGSHPGFGAEGLQTSHLSLYVSVLVCKVGMIAIVGVLHDCYED